MMSTGNALSACDCIVERFWLAVFLLALCIQAHLHLDGLFANGKLLLHYVSIAPSARIPVCPVLISHLQITARVRER